MGKTLNLLLRRNPKAPKLKTLATLAIARFTILKNHRQVRCSHARSDVLQLLHLGHQDRALLRVEHVIREQNMLDVFVMIENYCHLLTDGVLLVETNRECPEELNEAISSLIFASSRCGELPEIQEIRGIFASRYGKEFVARAVELKNNCRVNLKLEQKFSIRQASLETRQKLLKQIAYDNGITLQNEDDDYATTEEKQDINQKAEELKPDERARRNDHKVGVDVHDFPEMMTRDEKFSESMKGRKQYKDVADAARDAFESAAYAAAAARAAVELSRSESWDEDPNDHNGSNPRQESAFISSKPKLGIDRGLGFDRIHPVDSFCSESEGEDDMAQNSYKKAGPERKLSSSSSDTDIDHQYVGEVTSDLDQTAILGEEIIFDESDDETGENRDSIPWLKHHHSGSDKKSNLTIKKFPKMTRHTAFAADESFSDDDDYKPHHQSPRWKPLNPQAEHMTYAVEGRSRLGNKHYLNDEKASISTALKHT